MNKINTKKLDFFIAVTKYYILICIRRFPFDYHNPIGYAVSFLIQSATIFAASALFVVTLILVIGICNFGVSFVSDIEENLRKLNDDIVLSTEQTLSSAKWTEIRAKFIDIIQFHADAKELSIFNSTKRQI